MIDISFEKGNAREIFDRLRIEWEDLFAEAKVSPFLSWGWMTAWFENFGSGLEPIFLTARRDRKLIGILALVKRTKSIFGIRVGRLGMMGSDHGGADYLDVMARAEDRAECVRAFIQTIGSRGDVDLIEFAELAQDSETYEILKDTSSNSALRYFRLTEIQSAICPQVDLSKGWQSVVDHSRRKANFQRRLRALERRSDFEFRSVTSVDQVGAAFDRFLDLHMKRRSELGGSELSGHPRLVSFHRQAVAELAQAGLIRFDELWLNGDCCASIYGLENGGTFYFYNSGYDTDLRQLSVGLVLLGLSLRAAVERGNSNYDLLRGDESYKFDWATSCRELVTLRLSGRTFPVKIHDRLGSISSKLVSFLRSGLPPRIAQPMQNWHRAVRRKRLFSSQ